MGRLPSVSDRPLTTAFVSCNMDAANQEKVESKGNKLTLKRKADDLGKTLEGAEDSTGRIRWSHVPDSDEHSIQWSYNASNLEYASLRWDQSRPGHHRLRLRTLLAKKPHTEQTCESCKIFREHQSERIGYRSMASPAPSASSSSPSSCLSSSPNQRPNLREGEEENRIASRFPLATSLTEKPLGPSEDSGPLMGHGTQLAT